MPGQSKLLYIKKGSKKDPKVDHSNVIIEDKKRKCDCATRDCITKLSDDEVQKIRELVYYGLSENAKDEKLVMLMTPFCVFNTANKICKIKYMISGKALCRKAFMIAVKIGAKKHKKIIGFIQNGFTPEPHGNTSKNELTQKQSDVIQFIKQVQESQGEPEPGKYKQILQPPYPSKIYLPVMITKQSVHNDYYELFEKQEISPINASYFFSL